MTGKLMLEDRTRTTLIPKYPFLKLDTYMYRSRYNVWGNCISQIWPSSTGHQYTGPFRYLKWTVLLTVLLTVSRDRKARFWIKEELESRVLKYSMVGERDLLHLSVINIVYYEVDALPYLPKSSSLRHILIYEWFELLCLEALKTLYICGCRLTLWPPFFNVL